MKRRFVALVSAVALLAGCSGGSAMPPRAAAGAPSGGVQAALVRITIPAPPATLSIARRAQFVSPSTNGVLVDVYAASDATHSHLLGSSATDISSGSTACGGAIGTPRTCVVPVPAPVGDDVYVLATYDQPPANGNFSGAKQLGAGNVAQTIVAGQDNTANVTLGGVIASVQIALTTAIVRGTTASSQVLRVEALDADGNTIVSDGYIDASGNPVTIALAQTIVNSSGGGGSGTTSATGANGGTVRLATASLTQPSASGVALDYDGTANTPACDGSPCDGTFVDTITATPSNGGTADSATLTTSGPKIVEYPVPTADSFPTSIVVGADGELWFTESPIDTIGKITIDGAITQYVTPTEFSGARDLAAGPDGNVWFTETSPSNIAKITTSGAITEYATPVTNSEPGYIVTGSDGNLWFTEFNTNKIGTSTPSGTMTEYAIPTAAAGLAGITVGPDGNVWFSEINANAIGTMTSRGTVTEYAVPTANAQPSGITSGPDGNLWFTEVAGNAIGKVTPSGTFSEYAVPTAGSYANRIAVGPDGNLWFTETNGGKLGRISPSGAITEYALPMSAGPWGITVGPDGNLWFTDIDANSICTMSL